jgi:hypothetical protein
MESKDDDYYDIFFSYYNLETTEEKSLTYYESYSFIAHGFIVKESIMYDAKLNPSLTPEVNSETIFGFYDPGMRSGSSFKTKGKNSCTKTSPIISTSSKKF